MSIARRGRLEGAVKSTLQLVVICLGLVYGASLVGGPLTIGPAQAAKKAKRDAEPVVEADPAKLPTQVAEMRDAILAAARSGKIDELIVPIQWNELKPDFGDIDAAKPIEGWKKLSIDGEGREILAILLDILESPYAVVRRGPDIENNKVYIWPFYAEVPLEKAPPHIQTQLLRIVPREHFKESMKTGKYSYWRLAIGADGTWHSFAKPASK